MVRPPVRPSLEVHGTGPRHRIAGFGATQVQLWAGSISEKAILETAASHDRIRAAGHARVGVFAVAEAAIPLPEPGVRRVASEIMAKNRGELACNTVVVAGDGFWASAARSVITAIFVLAKPGVPSKVFDGVSEAASWHARELGLDDGEALAAAVEALRAELRAEKA